MATRQQAFSVYAMAYAWRGPFTYTDDTLNFASLLGQIDAARHESLAEIGDLEKRLREAGMLSDATADTRALDAAEEDAALTRAGAAEVRRERDIAQAQAQANQDLYEAALEELKKAKRDIARMLEHQSNGWQESHSRAARLDAIGVALGRRGKESTEEAASRVAAELAARGTELQQAKEALEQARAKVAELQATIADFEQERLRLAADAQHGREHAAAEMRERAASLVWDRTAGGGLCALSLAARQALDGAIRVLPLSPERPRPRDPDLDAQTPETRIVDTTRALIAIGVSPDRAEQAARIAEEEGGAAPETAHSAVLRLAKRGAFRADDPETAAEMLRKYLRAMMGAATAPAGLSAEDAATLRGAGWTLESPGVWRDPADGMTYDSARPYALGRLQRYAAHYRAGEKPATAHGEPERLTGEVTAATGSSSVAPTGGAAQGAPMGRVPETFELTSGAWCACPGAPEPRPGQLIGLCGTCDKYRAFNEAPMHPASTPQGLPKPPRVEVGQRWRHDRMGTLDVFEVGDDGGTRDFDVRLREAVNPHPAEAYRMQSIVMLASDHWTFLSPAPQGPTGGGEPEKSEPAEPTDLDKIEALSAHVKAAVARGEERQRARDEQDIGPAAPAEATPLEPTAADAVAGMLLRRRYPLIATDLAHGRLNIEHTLRVLARDPVSNDDRACIAALEALARGELSRPRHAGNLVAAIDRLTKARDKAAQDLDATKGYCDRVSAARDEARAEAAALREERDRIQRELEQKAALLHELESARSAGRGGGHELSELRREHQTDRDGEPEDRAERWAARRRAIDAALFSKSMSAFARGYLNGVRDTWISADVDLWRGAAATPLRAADDVAQDMVSGPHDDPDGFACRLRDEQAGVSLWAQPTRDMANGTRALAVGIVSRLIERCRAEGARVFDGEQLLHDEKRGVRLVIAKSADAREVLATVAELLGLSGARVVGEPDPRSVEQIEAEAHASRKDRPALASRMESYASGIREGERRAAEQLPDLMRRMHDDARVDAERAVQAKRERHQATARGLAEKWEGVCRDLVKRAGQPGEKWTQDFQMGAANRASLCILDICRAFGLAPPDGGPKGGETPERSEAEQHAVAPVSRVTSDVGGDLQRDVAPPSDARLSEIARLEDDGDIAGARTLLEQVAADLGEDDSRVVAARWELRMAEGRGTPEPTPQDGSSAIRSADMGLPAGEWSAEARQGPWSAGWDVEASGKDGTQLIARFYGEHCEERARAYARWISGAAPAAATTGALRGLAAEWLQDAREIEDSAREERAKLKAGKPSRFMLGFLTGRATSSRECAKGLCRVAGIAPPQGPAPKDPSSPPGARTCVAPGCGMAGMRTEQPRCTTCGADTGTLRDAARPFAKAPQSTRGSALRDVARASGAEPRRVTPEGYTQLPAEMLETLGIAGGGSLWFLRSAPHGRWEAWLPAELDEEFGLGTSQSSAQDGSSAPQASVPALAQRVCEVAYAWSVGARDAASALRDAVRAWWEAEGKRLDAAMEQERREAAASTSATEYERRLAETIREARERGDVRDIVDGEVTCGCGDVMVEGPNPWPPGGRRLCCCACRTEVPLPDEPQAPRLSPLAARLSALSAVLDPAAMPDAFLPQGRLPTALELAREAGPERVPPACQEGGTHPPRGGQPLDAGSADLGEVLAGDLGEALFQKALDSIDIPDELHDALRDDLRATALSVLLRASPGPTVSQRSRVAAKLNALAAVLDDSIADAALPMGRVPTARGLVAQLIDLVDSPPAPGASPAPEVRTPAQQADLDALQAKFVAEARTSGAAIASELARRWLQPRLNMLNRKRFLSAPGQDATRYAAATASSRTWANAIRQLCKAFAISEPQPEGPGAEAGRRLLDEEARAMAEGIENVPIPSSPPPRIERDQVWRNLVTDEAFKVWSVADDVANLVALAPLDASSHRRRALCAELLDGHMWKLEPAPAEPSPPARVEVGQRWRRKATGDVWTVTSVRHDSVKMFNGVYVDVFPSWDFRAQYGWEFVDRGEAQPKEGVK